MTETRAELLQRAYYASTAACYDDAHIEASEHRLGLELMLAAIRHYGFESILDVGSGTGRALTFIKREMPALRVVGIEPSPELRAVGMPRDSHPRSFRRVTRCSSRSAMRRLTLSVSFQSCITSPNPLAPSRRCCASPGAASTSPTRTTSHTADR